MSEVACKILANGQDKGVWWTSATFEVIVAAAARESRLVGRELSPVIEEAGLPGNAVRGPERAGGLIQEYWVLDKSRTTAAKHSRAYVARQKAKGLTRVPVWIPDNKDAKSDLLKFAAVLRGEEVSDD